MRKAETCLFAVLLAATILAPAPRLLADDDDDHRIARDALQRGLVRPFSEIQEIVKAAMPGEILGVELESDDGVLLYEIEVMSTQGQLMEVKIDAKTGKVVKVEQDDEDD